jgi:hypothetical protein
MRWYLIDIHKFYHRFYRNSFDAPIMPCIIAGVTLSCILGVVDFIFGRGQAMNEIKSIHPLAVTFPVYFFILIFYIYYKNKLPSAEELNKKEGGWIGITISVASIIGLLIASTTS